MATHDYVIANGTGAAVRSDLNNALAAIVSNNSSSSEPGTTYAYQWWADTNANVLKIRNSSNDGWITLRELDGTMLIEDGSASTPGLAFADDVNTGIFSPAADQIGFATGGAERLEIGSSEVVFNDPSNDVDFRVESNGQPHMLFVDAGNDRVGIGTSGPKEVIDARGAAVFSGDHATSQNAYGTAHGIMLSSTSNLASIKAVSNGSNNVDIQFIPLSSGSGSEAMRIDSSGRLLVGTSSARSVSSLNSSLQVEGTGGDSSTISVVRNVASAAPPRVVLGKSRGSSVGSSIVVQDDDSLGEISFSGADGTDANSVAATILCKVDGTPGSNDMPGRIQFATTADGASSPTERMRIDSSGNVGIGTTSPTHELTVHGASATTGTIEANRFSVRDNFGNPPGLGNGFYSPGANNLAFATNSTEGMRLDSSGRLLINHTADTSPVGYEAKLQLCDTSFQGSSLSIRRDGGASGPTLMFTKSRGTTKGANTIVQSGDNVGTLRWFAADGTDANSEVAQIRAQIDNTPGSNDTPGRLIFKTTSDGASDVTERMRLDSSGRLLVGTSSVFSVTSSSATGNVLTAAGASTHYRSAGAALFVGRQSDDGDLVEFYQAGSLEGSISVSGGTVSYNGGHLARWSQLPSGAERTEILRGSVLSNLDEMCEWGEEDNEQLNRMKVSDVEGDVNVSGVFQAWDDDDDTYTNDFYCAMTGDFVIRIAQGTTVARGDLLMSAGDGTAKPQNDDIVRSKTIAKVTSTTVSTTYSDGSYCVPCVLMAC